MQVDANLDADELSHVVVADDREQWVLHYGLVLGEDTFCLPKSQPNRGMYHAELITYHVLDDNLERCVRGRICRLDKKSESVRLGDEFAVVVVFHITLGMLEQIPDHHVHNHRLDYTFHRVSLLLEVRCNPALLFFRKSILASGHIFL